MFVLKQLRKEKKLSQSKLAQKIGVSLRTVQLYEKKNANIPRKNLEKIAQIFEVSIADLYSLEGVSDVNPNYTLQKNRTKKGHVITKLGPGRYLIAVPLVIARQYTSYVTEQEGFVYMSSLPTISFVVEQVSVGNYVAFEIGNDSMDDGSLHGIPNKSVVLGKLVPIKKVANLVKENADANWIIVHKEGIMCKSIVSYDARTKLLQCSSRRKSPEYSDFEMDINDVQQLFLILRKQTA